MTQVVDETTADDELEGAEDDEAEAEPEPEPEQEPPTAQTDIDIEKQIGKLVNENQRHAKRVAEIMGDDFAGLHVCPACDGFAAGFVWELPEAGPIYQPDPDTEMCPVCQGEGDLATGAKTRNKLRQCRRCFGYGYIELGGAEPRGDGPPRAQPVATPTDNGPTAAPRSDTDDPWGRPAGHVHWGLPPSSIGA